jgi:hypothetical protein
MVKLERIKLLKKFTSTTKTFKTLTVSEASYLAGLIDGEGCFSLSGNVYRMSIVNTHNIIINLCNTYGGCWYYVSRNRPRDKRPWYMWQWNVGMMKHYLPQILPYLQIKSEQAKLMIEALKYSQGTGKEETKKNLKFVEKY